ncbi:zinc finger protein 853-like [Drosophila albomicans]|uniref:Zinc finger protein 853-like n=1 Tax=Drosophila albomicans TaxID=7291 RepID=A0A9C6TDJ4_DROAB|nr:zinc finger protein 853-like [Drosophila albomicans]
MALPNIEEVRQKCGTVYTWNCAGELYGIECELCEERPLCALDEFAEHMELWHSDWQQSELSSSSPSSLSLSLSSPPIEDELMHEVLAEQQQFICPAGDCEVNELKQQLVQELNALDTQQPATLTLTLTAQQQQQQQLLLVDTLGPEERTQLRHDDASLPPAVENNSQKLSSEHVQQLIELYRSETRLWNQTHPEFRNVELCRDSWRRITSAWSAHCGRSFSVTEVRIRVSTLCQRYIKQRERLDAEGEGGNDELDDGSKFVHYDQLRFLGEQQTLLKRQEHVARENRKLLEIYEHYPILWHNAHKRLRCTATMRQRHEAHRGLQLALSMCGIKLSGLAMQRRLQSLRKRYRLEKIRYLHSVVEGKQLQFVARFEHYAEMEFLHKHIDPYVCAVCGKIFEQLPSHQAHVQSGCEGQQQVEELQQQVEKAATLGELMTQLEQQQLSETLPQVEEQVEEADQDQAKEISLPQVEELPLQQPLHNLRKLKEDQTEPNNDGNTYALRVRLSLPQTHKLIELYQAQPQLWDPNHLDYQARVERRQGWQQIANELNAFAGTSYSWQMLHRKLIDYIKYYRRERQQREQQRNDQRRDQQGEQQRELRENDRQHDQQIDQQGDQQREQQSDQQRNDHQNDQQHDQQRNDRQRDHQSDHKRNDQQRNDQKNDRQRNDRPRNWSFYQVFSFLDDIVPISCELQKTLQQRESNLKIIQVYRSYEQLWCTQHPDYTKRKQRQRQLESLCTRLQEECNLQISLERLRNRLIEFRCQYRQCKQARLEAVQHGVAWQASYEYYEPLQFLEQHVAPFGCGYCADSFKRRSDFVRHQRQVHGQQQRGRNSSPNSPSSLEHICHICGMKFSLRTSLLAHLRRHLGQRTHACNECPKKFFNSTALRVHQRSHTKELPYVCEHCARGFVNASKLNQHLKRHAEQRDYPCSRCDKAFYTAHERDRHTRAHLNIRDKVCPYCNRAFVVGSAYYAHLNLHRGEKRYSCSNCGQRFAQYAGLYKHRKRCTANANGDTGNEK